ncbi:MAG: hypothetical protein PHV78_02495 [Patescibacteria group bacterium]|nr:hypothetical protein [Patescibacteria group bacterium]MDD5120986.1 hypothetical protein [Patescibacteria group bacterium]MDD5222138.1 hypothetical protein [Patescibacteria group bacterium]MDD5396095.1 hypothetical protein [Patescibacteria group bacterium]
MKFEAKKKIIIVCVQLLIVLGFVIGADWASESFHRFFHSYYADIALPLGFYFLLKTLEDKYAFLHPWYWKATAVFLLVSTSEILQFFGIYAFARIFDPLDFLAYAGGVLSAAFIDRTIFTKVFNSWE